MEQHDDCGHAAELAAVQAHLAEARTRLREALLVLAEAPRPSALRTNDWWAWYYHRRYPLVHNHAADPAHAERDRPRRRFAGGS